MGKPLLDTLAPGTVLGEKYQVDELLAQGGMGAVYAATHTLLSKPVAIKVLHPSLADEPDAVKRFQREALACSQIGHDNICEVLDMGQTEAGVSFLVMERLNGMDLGEVLLSEGALSVPRACHIALQILSAVDAVHAAGIVHRDLKPANVFLAKRSQGEVVKVLDFGISRMHLSEGVDTRLTETGTVLGTPAFMSPEQACGRADIGPLSDLYSIGVILYQMVTGHLPFPEANYNQLIFRVVAGDFPPPRKYVPDLPEELEDAILEAMEMLPGDRFATAEGFARAIARFAPGPTPSFAKTTQRNAGLAAIEGRLATPGGNTTVAMNAGRAVKNRAALAGRTEKKRHWPYVGVAVALGAAALAWPLVRSAPAPEAAATAPRSEAPPRATAPTKTPSPPTTVVISFDVTPKGALVVLDGAALSDTRIEREVDERRHELVVTAPGYITRRTDLKFAEDQRVDIQLVPEPAPSTRATPSPPPRRAKKRRETPRTTRGLMKDNPYGD